jgi:hypothetical protein
LLLVENPAEYGVLSASVNSGGSAVQSHAGTRKVAL